jgi:hypothetical protein
VLQCCILKPFAFFFLFTALGKRKKYFSPSHYSVETPERVKVVLVITCFLCKKIQMRSFINKTKKEKLHGLSPRVNYTDRATAACRRSDCQLLRGQRDGSLRPYSQFLDRSRYFSIK